MQLSPDGAWLACLTKDKIYIHKTDAVKDAKYTLSTPPGTKIYELMFSAVDHSLIYVASNFENCSEYKHARKIEQYQKLAPCF